MTRQQDNEDRHGVRCSTLDGLGLADEAKKPIDRVGYMLQSNNNVGGDKTKLLSRWITESQVVASTAAEDECDAAGARLQHCIAYLPSKPRY